MPRRLIPMLHLCSNNSSDFHDSQYISHSKRNFIPGIQHFSYHGLWFVRTPYYGLFGVRTSDTLNVLLVWEKPHKILPHFKQKMDHPLPYINYLYKGLHRTSRKYMIINYDRIRPKYWFNHSFWTLLIWPHPARFKICLVTWTHYHVIVTWHCHSGCLDTKWLSRNKHSINHQGRNPSSFGLRVSAWWFPRGFWLNRIPLSALFVISSGKWSSQGCIYWA